MIGITSTMVRSNRIVLPSKGDIRIGNIRSIENIKVAHEVKRRFEYISKRRSFDLSQGLELARSHRFELSGDVIRIDSPFAPILMDLRLVEHSRYFGKHTVNAYIASVASVLNLDASARDQRGFCTDLMERVYAITLLRDRLHWFVNAMTREMNNEVRVDVITDRELAETYDASTWVPGKRQLGKSRLSYIVSGPVNERKPPRLLLEQCHSMRPLDANHWQIVNETGTYWICEIVTASLFDQSDRSVIWAAYGEDTLPPGAGHSCHPNTSSDVIPAAPFIREGNPYFESDLEWLSVDSHLHVRNCGRCELTLVRR
jgi:hypothetical protein